MNIQPRELRRKFPMSKILKPCIHANLRLDEIETPLSVCPLPLAQICFETGFEYVTGTRNLIYGQDKDNGGFILNLKVDL